MPDPTKFQEESKILASAQIAPSVFVLTLAAPNICKAARPGQFVHVKAQSNAVQLLRMPFCVYDVDLDAKSIDICFQVVGEGTKQLSKLVVGDMVSVLGPIGNGWSMPKDAKHALLISGGLGAAPLNLLARELAAAGTRVDIVMGAQSSDMLVCRDRLTVSAQRSGGFVKVSTDDGSEGLHGFCTQISDELLKDENCTYDYMCICGPGPMERNAVKVPLQMNLDCEVSLERLMACGIGACLSCIVETVNGRKRCCVDGPVFKAQEVVW